LPYSPPMDSPPQDLRVLPELLLGLRKALVAGTDTELSADALAQRATPASLLSLACKCGVDVAETADVIMTMAENCGASSDVMQDTEAEMGSWFADQARQAGSPDDLSA